MKKALSIILTFFCICAPILAQDNINYLKHEIYAKIGPRPTLSLLPENTPQFAKLNVPFVLRDEEYSGVMTVGYMINLSGNLAIGLSYSKCEMETDLWLNAAEFKTATVSAKYNVWMLDARYKWLDWKGLSLYSQAGVGAVIMKVDEPAYDDRNSIGSITGWEDKNNLAWHIAPLGIQYTLFKHIGLFAEGGIGTKSCLSGGLRIMF